MRTRNILQSLFPDTRRKILTIVFQNPARWWYLREMAARACVTPSSLQRELGQLVEAGVLESRQDGRRVYFRAHPQLPILHELVSLVRKTAGVNQAVLEVLEPFGDSIIAAFIFGSIAVGSDHSGSDVDLMVIGTVGLSDITPGLRRVERELEREVNPVALNPEELRQRLQEGNHFIRSVLDTPREFIIGSEADLADAVKKREG